MPVEKLRPFEGQPFQVKDYAEMNQLSLESNPVSMQLLKDREKENTHTHEQSIYGGSAYSNHYENFGNTTQGKEAA